MIQYDLSGGLQLQGERYLGGRLQSSAELFINGEEFAPFDPSSEFARSCATQLAAPKIGRIGAKQLVYGVINEDSANAVLYGMAWGSNFEHPIGQAMVSSMAYCLPDYRIISWNAPGHGSHNRSSALPRGIMGKAARTGSYSDVGKYLERGLVNALESADSIDVVGTSEGARICLAVIAALGRPVRNVVLLDPPGSRHMTRRVFVKGFAKDEKEHSIAYARFSKDPLIAEEVASYNRLSSRMREVFQQISRRNLFNHTYRTVEALRQGGLKQDVKAALPYIVGRLCLVVPLYSAFSTTEAMREVARSCSTEHLGKVIELWTFNGSHAFINAGNMPEAKLLTRILG